MKSLKNRLKELSISDINAIKDFVDSGKYDWFTAEELSGYKLNKKNRDGFSSDFLIAYDRRPIILDAIDDALKEKITAIIDGLDTGADFGKGR